MSSLTITYKPTMAEAGTIKRALEEYHKLQLDRLLGAGGGSLARGIELLPGTAQEIERTEMILRRDFQSKIGMEVPIPATPASEPIDWGKSDEG